MPTPVEPTAGDGPQPDPTPEEDAASRAEQPDEVEEPQGHSEEGGEG